MTAVQTTETPMSETKPKAAKPKGGKKPKSKAPKPAAKKKAAKPTTAKGKATGKAPKSSEAKKPKAKPAAKKPKGGKKAKPNATIETNGKPMSLYQAAQIVLARAGKSMTCAEIYRAITEAKLWTPLDGATPERTLYSSLLGGWRKKDANNEFVEKPEAKIIRLDDPKGHWQVTEHSDVFKK